MNFFFYHFWALQNNIKMERSGAATVHISFKNALIATSNAVCVCQSAHRAMISTAPTVRSASLFWELNKTNYIMRGVRCSRGIVRLVTAATQTEIKCQKYFNTFVNYKIRFKICLKFWILFNTYKKIQIIFFWNCIYT